MSLTVASLASGSGALEMALELWLGAGALDLRWHAEVDPGASLVLKTHRPAVPNLGDFTVPGFWESAERCSLHAGGIPCQPFSAAGRQLGEADARHLWPFWREGIALHRPATVVFENVANLTRGKMRPTFDGIIADLLALGYDVRWCLLGACAVGAAHHRHRVFLLACRSRTTPNAAQVTVRTCGQHGAAYLPTPSAVSYGSNQGGGAGRTGPVCHSLDALARLELLPTPVKEDAVRGVLTDFAGREWTQREGRTSSGMLGTEIVNLFRTPAHRDGDARGQGSIEHMRRRVEKGDHLNLGDQVALLPTPRHSDAKNGGPNQGIASGDIALSSAVQLDRWGKYARAIARHEAVLGRSAPEPTEIGPKGGRRLAAAFSEWLMMLPEGHLTDVLPRNPALARAGNGVVPLQAATAYQLLFDNLVARH